MFRFRSLTTAALFGGLCVAPALAQDPPAAPAEETPASQGTITLELNNLTQVENNCLVTFLTKNEMGAELGEVGIQIVTFDREGRMVGDLLTIKLGRLGEEKSRVRRYVLPELSCDSISSILVNDVTECTGDGIEPAACLDALRTSTRVEATLDL